MIECEVWVTDGAASDVRESENICMGGSGLGNTFGARYGVPLL